MKHLAVSLFLAFAAVGLTQPSRLAWNRSSSSADITMDAARCALVDSQGRLVVAGSSKIAGGKRVGNISIFNRNRNLIKSIEVAPSGNASLEFSRLMEEEGIFYFFASRTETVDNDETITVYKYDSNLNLLGSNSFNGNAAVGREVVSSAFFDEADALFAVGLATDGTKYRTFLSRINKATLAVSNIELPGLADLPTPPSITITADQTVVVGKAVDLRAELRAFTPNLGVKWEGPDYDAATLSSTISNLVSIDNTIYLSAAKNQDIEVENDETHWMVQKVGSADGVITGLEWPEFTSPNQVSPGPIVAANGSIFASYTVQGKTVVKRVDPNLNPTGSFELSTPGLQAHSLLVDKFGEVFGTGMAASPNIFGCFKLNPGMQYRFGYRESDFDFARIAYESGSTQHEPSGDIFTWETDGNRMRLTCIQQAPIAVTDGVYQVKKSRLFRPAQPITINDRYAAGATLTISQQPAHGTVTIGANGFFNYTPAQNYVGPDAFKYRLEKTGLSASAASVNLSVKP